MSDINKVILAGRLVKDAQLTYTTGGTAKIETSIAVNESVKTNGQWENKANFFDVTIWGKTAENLKNYLCKGKQIVVEGKLQQQRWKDSNGNNKSKVAITAENIQLFSGNSESQFKSVPANEVANTANNGEFPDLPF